MLLLNHNLVIAMIIDGKLCVTTELNQECTTKDSDKALQSKKAFQDTNSPYAKSQRLNANYLKEQLTFSVEVLPVAYDSSSLLTNVGRTKAAL